VSLIVHRRADPLRRQLLLVGLLGDELRLFGRSRRRRFALVGGWRLGRVGGLVRVRSLGCFRRLVRIGRRRFPRLGLVGRRRGLGPRLLHHFVRLRLVPPRGR